MWGYLQKDTAEQEGYAEACMSLRMAETDTADTSKKQAGLLEEILSTDNLYQAYKQVRRNKGAGGIDRMAVHELEPWLREHQDELVESLRTGRYRPQPVRLSLIHICTAWGTITRSWILKPMTSR